MGGKKGLKGLKIRRFQREKSLDLDYITDRIIAMSFPVSGIKAKIFSSGKRNKISHVKTFLEAQHHAHYKVFNLSHRKTYSAASFDGRVAEYPVDGEVPKLWMIRDFCNDMESWLEAHGHNVAVVHCDDGKKITGVMICAYLLRSGHCIGANEAIRLFTMTRSEVAPEVFLRSHIRYLNYYEKILKEGPKPSSLLIMTKIVIKHPPASVNPLNVWISITCSGKAVICKNYKHSSSKGFEFDTGRMFLTDDVCVEMFNENSKHKIVIFSFNTAFVEKYHMILQKRDMDIACEDVTHAIYPKQFAVEVHFLSPQEEIEAVAKEPKLRHSRKNIKDAPNFAAQSLLDITEAERRLEVQQRRFSAFINTPLTPKGSFHESLEAQSESAPGNGTKPVSPDKKQMLDIKRSQTQPITLPDVNPSEPLIVVEQGQKREFDFCKPSFEAIMSNEQLYKVFYEYLRSKSSLAKFKHQFEFYFTCQNDFKHLVEKQVQQRIKAKTIVSRIDEFSEEHARKLFQTAKKIYSDYYVPYSPTHINFPPTAVAKVKEFIYSNDSSFAMFDESMSEVYKRLESQCFPNFLQSEVWFRVARQARPICFGVRSCGVCKAGVLPHQPQLVIEKSSSGDPPETKNEEPLTNGELAMGLDEDKIYHWDCVQCAKCSRSLKAQKCCIIENGEVICGACDNHDFFVVCTACNKIIFGKSMSFQDTNWHPDCFVCYICHIHLNAQQADQFQLINGVPVCNAHASQLTQVKFECGAGETCKYLKTPAPKEETTFCVMNGEWHRSCFACQVCEKILSVREEYLEHDSKPMCLSCTRKSNPNITPDQLAQVLPDPIDPIEELIPPEPEPEPEPKLEPEPEPEPQRKLEACYVCSQALDEEMDQVFQFSPEYKCHRTCFCCSVCERNLSVYVTRASDPPGKSTPRTTKPVTDLPVVEPESKPSEPEPIDDSILDEVDTSNAEPDTQKSFLDQLDEQVGELALSIDDIGLELNSPKPPQDSQDSSDPPAPEPEPGEAGPDAESSEIPLEVKVEETITEQVQQEEKEILYDQIDPSKVRWENGVASCEFHLRDCFACAKNIASNPHVWLFGEIYHSACSLCVFCRKALTSESQIIARDNGLICTDHNDRICVVCKKLVGNEKSFAITSPAYGVYQCHLSCFACSCCSISLDELPFQLDLWEGQLSLLCLHHTLHCVVCKLAFVSSVPPIEVHGNYWHPECCVCSVCKNALSLVDAVGRNSAGEFICMSHKVVELCALGCGNAIMPGQPALIKDNRPFHEECFVCAECGLSLENLGCYDWGENGDHLKVTCTTHCLICKKGIHGAFIQLPDQTQLHAECFVCHKCSSPISGGYLCEGDHIYTCANCL